MNKASIIILITMLSNTVFSQSFETKRDSFLQLIETAIEDTTKANFYNELAQLYSYSKPKEGFKYAFRALSLSKESDYYEGITGAYLYIFNCHYFAASGSDSLLHYTQLLENYVQVHDNKTKMVNVFWNYGIYYGLLNQTDKEIEANIKALEIVRRGGYSNQKEAELLSNIGVAMGINGNHLEALEYYKEALKIIRISVSRGIILKNIAGIYGEHLNQTDSAKFFYKEAYKVFEETGSYYGMSEILITKGVYKDREKKYTEANQYYKKALGIIETNEIGHLFPFIYEAFATHYSLQKQFQRSIDYGEKGIKTIKEVEGYNLLSKTYKVLNESYAGLGNYKKAYEVRGMLIEHNDSISTTSLKNKVEELETVFSVEQKEAENKLLKSQKVQDQLAIRQRTIIGVGVILILLLLAAFLRYSNQQRKRQNELLEQKVEKRTVELQAANKNLEQANLELRTFNYIASHDIKEPIRNIGSYVGLIRRKLPNDLKENLSDYFDTIKRSTNQLYTLIEDFAHYTTMSKSDTIERQSVDLNLLTTGIVEQLEKRIKKYNGQVLISNLPTIKTGNSLLFTTLKNLIENGLKYNNSEKPTVNIDYNQTEIHHEIIVLDNGIGIDEAYHEKIFEMFKRLHNRSEYEGSGIGLAIVKLSVDKLGGKVKLESDEGKGSRFVIELPLV